MVFIENLPCILKFKIRVKRDRSCELLSSFNHLLYLIDFKNWTLNAFDSLNGSNRMNWKLHNAYFGISKTSLFW